MSTLPPSPFCSTLASAMTVESAAAPHLTDPAVAAADYLPSVTPARAPTTAAAGANAAAGFLDGTDCIGEIFVGARRLEGREIPLDELIDRGFDVEAFMLDVEPPPLFLQRRA